MNESAQAVRKGGGRATMLGIVTMILGLFAMLAPLMAGMSIALLVGILVLLAGISRLVWAFRAGTTGKGIFMLIIGLLTVVCGVAMLANPVFAAGVLTIVLAAYLTIDGISEIIVAFEARPLSGWGWVLFSGIVSLVLGIMIWRQFPLSGPWAIGLFLGIKLFFIGWIMIMFGTTARSIAKNAG